MKILYIFFLLLTVLSVGVSYKIKDDFFYLPYPNAIEYVLALLILLITLTTAIWKKHRRRKLLLGLAASATLLIAVNSINYFLEWHPLNLSLPFSQSQSFEVSHEPYNKWLAERPESVGLNRSDMEQYLDDIESWERLRGLIIIKDGKIIVEKYQKGATRYSAFNVHSITKSILSALTGIAIQQGYLRSEHELVMPFFPEYQRQLKDLHKDKLTIDHLLTMRAGFTGWDGPQNVEQVILHEKVSEPKIGQEFKYFTGSQMLLSAILTRSTGKNTREFAEEQLFKPLGIQCAFWRKVDGYYAGGDETWFTARDLARFGELYLHQGKINGLQLLDAAWVEKSFTNYTPDSKAFRNRDCYQEVGYGYSWWLLNHKEQPVYAARGKGGQHLLILPNENIIGVILQEWNLRKNVAMEEEFIGRLLSILTSEPEMMTAED
ncbi:CubicO group peptidase, beta-lactamase class C family [Cyclobacterium lianum]|uniref:CubicO group peptidase, beta-lactamase class C family n=1 Tax=Cyclobacterium lianum TaxID=388280 RepID=A0A1M7N359_9BACT|nr:serine hydrolase [Cyclobacterium lianum]SHM97958.1 CubicO group peptidase, beta-lactamase class C family [Cyclobacterium lianum]